MLSWLPLMCEPAVEGGGGDIPEGAGTIDAALPVADAHLNVAPGVEIGGVELETDGVVGRLDVQRGAQRQVESVDSIEGSCVFVEFVTDVAVPLHPRLYVGTGKHTELFYRQRTLFRFLRLDLESAERIRLCDFIGKGFGQFRTSSSI